MEEMNDGIEEVKMNESTVEKEEERIPDPAELKCATKQNVTKLAGSIVAKFREHGYAKIRAIGDGAIGRAFKAGSISIGRLKQMDLDSCMTGAFFSVDVKKKDRDGNETDERSILNGCIINVEPR